LRQLEAETARLKKLVAEQALANEVLTEALVNRGLLCARGDRSWTS
jgi:hypothetical protein